ncbi:MAG TPA: prolyl oligopeptidase family serine peptidase [Anaerohalosphaeraceae bacterium]|nr:prolyl oligopeptidase family serine peptidase [Anaerohalosphaeraceae bacterium]HOL89950.1 prolyl oligopeptidase family serine peptidase [Anaerohalosphaeraceae bacterium]HPP56322.1 prolyl oligopeptidase family serine peptidase [Anaerohalosphaeraceae bacterium]
MQFRLFFVLTALTVGLLTAAEEQAMNSQKKQERQKARHLERKVTLTLDYLLYLPPDYEQKDSWPLLVFLHGAGERGSDLNRVKAHGPAKLVEQGRDFPFVIVSPQCPEGQWWPILGREVLALIDEMLERYKIDPDRVYLTGLSMGGYGTWAIASAWPERFAAIVPICGGGRPFTAANLEKVPVWAFHGAKDPVVPLSESQQMVEAVNRAGGKAKLTVYPDAEHDSWTQTYDNPELYQWLLSHRRARD